MIGTQINERYRIDGELGHGGMGTVYKGYDSTLKRDIAIKLMTDTRLGTEGRGRLLEEAQAIAQLSHPNVITVYDVGEYEKNPFIVMEYVEGVNLYEQPPKEIEEIVAVAQQVCAALAHAHEHGIIHRDLKPENVILTAEGTAKLMDFGLARSISSRLTSEGTILGTVFYLAPEQAQGKTTDPRSDLYSLGVMLYELTTGELPFVADDPLAVISQHIHAPVVPPRAKNEHIPPALEALVLALMEKDPAKRPDSAQGVLERLSAPEMLDVAALPLEELSVLDRIVRGRLVGREQELKQARQAWQQAMGGQGQLLLVSGEPGVGKTRLMREIITQAEVGGGQAYTGESQAEGNAPYAAFAQIVRRALRAPQNNGLDLPDLVMAELISIAPELRFDYQEIDPNPPLEPESEQRRLMESVFRFIDSLGQGKPLLLVLEDIHWADSGTLSLLQFLARRCREHPVMLLGTYREVELDDALAFHQTLLDLKRKNLGTRLKLERLDEDKTRDMLAVIFAEEITPDFLAGIYRETEGNPFFIEEVCKALIESGQVYFDGEIWQRPENMADMEIPQSIKVAVQSRVSKLSESAQEILLTAAVIGREFDFELLHKVTGKEENDLIEGLESILKSQLIEELKEGDGERFTFSHALIPTTLRESLSGMRRTRLHRKVAQEMEEVLPKAYQRLAYHWGEGGDLDKALDYTIKAAECAKETYANEDAIRLYSEALDLLPKDDERNFELLKNRSSMFDMILNRDAQLADIDAMLAQAEKSGNQVQQVDSLLDLGQFYIWTNPTFVRKPVERALKLSKHLGDLDRQARAEWLLSWYYELTNDFSKVRPHLEKAVDIAHSAGWKKRYVEYLSGLISFDTRHKKVGMDTYKTRFQELITLTEEINDKQLKSLLFYRITTIYIYVKDYQNSLSSAEESLKLAKEIGDSNYRLRALMLKAATLIGMEKFEKAEEIYLGILGEPDIFSTNMPRFAGFQIAALYIQMGEYEKSFEISKDLLRQAQQNGNEFLIFRTQLVFTFICFHLGKYRDSLESLHNSWKFIEGNLGRDLQATILGFFGRNYAYLGEFESANEYAKKALQLWDETSTTFFNAAVWLNCAYIALLEGKVSALEQGIHYTKKGLKFFEEYFLGADWWIYALLLRLEIKLLSEEEIIFSDIESKIEKVLYVFLENLLIIEDVPESLYFVVSHGLRVGNRDEEADEYLRKAYERVLLVAGKIQDEELRRSYLENVIENQEILQEAKVRGIAHSQ